MVELYLHSPHMSSWHCAKLMKHRDNFTFPLPCSNMSHILFTCYVLMFKCNVDFSSLYTVKERISHLYDGPIHPMVELCLH
jgi:hypothetical protein